jgi:hypothetical protein
MPCALFSNDTKLSKAYPTEADVWKVASPVVRCHLPVMLARDWIGGPLGALLEHSRAFQKLPVWHWNTSMQQAPHFT